MLPESRQSVEIAIGIVAIVHGRVIFARGGTALIHVDDEVRDLQGIGGESAVIMYGQTGGHYWLHGTVRSLANRVLTVDWKGPPEHRQRREHARIAVNLPVRLTGPVDHEGETHDLSPGGMRLTGNPGVGIDDEVSVEIQLPDGRPPIPAQARVVRHDDDSVGLAFEQISEHDRERLMLLPEPRQQVEVQVPEWGIITGHVVGVRGDTLVLEFDYEPRDLQRLPGAETVVMYGRAGGQYRLRATVVKADGCKLALACTGEPERHQRREFVRMPLHVPVRIALGASHFDHPRDTRDLSGGGLRLSRDWDLDFGVGDELSIEIDLPDGRAPVPARTRVVRADDNSISLMFERIAEAHRDRVVKLVFEHQRKAAGRVG